MTYNVLGGTLNFAQSKPCLRALTQTHGNKNCMTIQFMEVMCYTEYCVLFMYNN